MVVKPESVYELDREKVIRTFTDMYKLTPFRLLIDFALGFMPLIAAQTFSMFGGSCDSRIISITKLHA
jgi:hypothetical protein